MSEFIVSCLRFFSLRNNRCNPNSTKSETCIVHKYYEVMLHSVIEPLVSSICENYIVFFNIGQYWVAQHSSEADFLRVEIRICFRILHRNSKGIIIIRDTLQSSLWDPTASFTKRHACVSVPSFYNTHIWLPVPSIHLGYCTRTMTSM